MIHEAKASSMCLPKIGRMMMVFSDRSEHSFRFLLASFCDCGMIDGLFRPCGLILRFGGQNNPSWIYILYMYSAARLVENWLAGSFLRGEWKRSSKIRFRFFTRKFPDFFLDHLPGKRFLSQTRNQRRSLPEKFSSSVGFFFFLASSLLPPYSHISKRFEEKNESEKCSPSMESGPGKWTFL